MSHVAYPIATRRLILRPFVPEDLDDVWAYQRDPAVVRFMLCESRDRRQSEASLNAMMKEDKLAEEGDCLSLAVVWPEAGRVVGHVELVWLSRVHRQGEVGYVFNTEFQGRGFATEAAGEMLRLGFEHFDLHRIIGRCDARNEASARVLERLGMRREAHFRDNVLVKGEWKEELVYAMRQHEWRAKQRK